MIHPMIHDCKKELHGAHLKATPARLGVLAALESSDKPLDIVTIVDYLRVHHVKADKVTVFRIINTLAEKRLIKPVQLNEGKLRYESGSLADHHHFMCEKCGDIQDVAGCEIEKLENTFAKNKGVLIKRHSLEFFGFCTKCRKLYE